MQFESTSSVKTAKSQITDDLKVVAARPITPEVVAACAHSARLVVAATSWIGELGRVGWLLYGLRERLQCLIAAIVLVNIG